MKKWLVVVEDSQYEWIKKTAEDAGTKGSVVVRAVLSQAQREKTKDLIEGLREIQTKEAMEALMAERKELDEKIKALQTPKNRVFA